MLRHLRQSSRLAVVLVLALVAGPAAQALCPHPGGEDAHAGIEAPAAEMPGMDHGAMGHGVPAAPPCHEEAPQPEPEETDCLSPCCLATSGAPEPATPAPLASASAPPAVSVGEAPEPTPEAGRLDPAADPPAPPSVRLHLRLGRLLT